MFKERLKERREQLGLSQAALGEKVCVTQQIIAAYEKGIRKPNSDIVVELCNVLECSADYLLGRE